MSLPSAGPPQPHRRPIRRNQPPPRQARGHHIDIPLARIVSFVNNEILPTSRAAAARSYLNAGRAAAEPDPRWKRKTSPHRTLAAALAHRRQPIVRATLKQSATLRRRSAAELFYVLPRRRRPPPTAARNMWCPSCI